MALNGERPVKMFSCYNVNICNVVTQQKLENVWANVFLRYYLSKLKLCDVIKFFSRKVKNVHDVTNIQLQEAISKTVCPIVLKYSLYYNAAHNHNNISFLGMAHTL